MQIKKLYILSFFILLNLVGFSQLDGADQKEKWAEDNIFLDGKVTDYYTGDPIAGVTIRATAAGTKTIKGTSDGRGEYKTVLEYDKTYTITFSKSGFTSKTITMNTSGVPDLKRQKVPDMGAEITLFKPNDCIQTTLLDAPIGKAVYFANKNVMDWDMEYSMPRLQELNKLLDKCAKEAEKAAEEEKAKEKEYSNLMKTGDKSFTKEELQEALSDYKAASNLYPDREGPKKKIQLIETELAKKAEGEKQRAEEKARAKAEAIAKSEAEAAAKLAEEEKAAKEKAEAEALAKFEAAAKEKEKAEEAAKKAEEEKLAKEKKEADALAKKEAEEKALAAAKAAEAAKKEVEKKEAEALAKKESNEKETLIKESADRKAAEEKARKEEKAALAKMEEENKAKEAAEKEAQERAAAEVKALEEKLAAIKREREERAAKEEAAKLAQKAEEERAANAKVMVDVQAEVKIEVDKREAQATLNNVIQVENEPKPKDDLNGSATIKFKSNNKGRHLYEKPNKHRKGKGPQPKKRIVF